MEAIEKITRFTLMIFLLMSLSTQAFASKDKRHKEHLFITSVEVNNDAGTFVINGFNFEKNKHDDDDRKHNRYRKVMLGEHEIVVESWADTMISAFLPPGILPGDYQLVVMNKKGKSHRVIYGLTIGAVGPVGDKGDKGDNGLQGATGAQGDQGIQGAPGRPGIPGAKGDKGDKGDQGVQGLKGDKGDKGEPGMLGLAGQECSAGVFIRGFDANGNILCGPPPVVCSPLSRQISMRSSFSFPILQAWPGGTVSVTGSTGCSVIIAQPSDTISNLSGNTWAVTSRTGYTTCSVSSAGNPSCGAVASFSDTLSNGRPYCSNAATTIFDNSSTAAANVTCR